MTDTTTYRGYTIELDTFDGTDYLFYIQGFKNVVYTLDQAVQKINELANEEMADMIIEFEDSFEEYNETELRAYSSMLATLSDTTKKTDDLKREFGFNV